MLDLRFYLWFKCKERFYKDAFYIQVDAGIYRYAIVHYTLNN